MIPQTNLIIVGGETYKVKTLVLDCMGNDFILQPVCAEVLKNKTI
jgi:hypothetical protein